VEYICPEGSLRPQYTEIKHHFSRPFGLSIRWTTTPLKTIPVIEHGASFPHKKRNSLIVEAGASRLTEWLPFDVDLSLVVP
jgi:hypothetical protein